MSIRDEEVKDYLLELYPNASQIAQASQREKRNVFIKIICNFMTICAMWFKRDESREEEKKPRKMLKILKAGYGCGRNQKMEE